MVEDFADDFHKIHKGNGTIYYFSGEFPRSYYKFNIENNTLESLSLDNLFHFYTDNDIPHYIRGISNQIKRLNENDEIDVAYKVENNILGREIDFGYKHNDKVVFNQSNKIFTISFLEDHALTEVSEFPINHFGGLNQFYNFRTGNSVYFLFPENLGSVIYSLNLDTYEWNIETEFPGGGANYYWFTGEGEDIIMGGGAIDNYINVESRFEFKKGDFWKYNITDKTWKILGYIPYDSKFISSNVVSREGIHYYITSETLPFSYLTSFDFKKFI
jgi:Ca2+-binding RTX toxin-like protein